MRLEVVVGGKSTKAVCIPPGTSRARRAAISRAYNAHVARQQAAGAKGGGADAEEDASSMMDAPSTAPPVADAPSTATSNSETAGRSPLVWRVRLELAPGSQVKVAAGRVLYHGGRGAHLELLTCERMRNAIEEVSVCTYAGRGFLAAGVKGFGGEAVEIPLLPGAACALPCDAFLCCTGGLDPAGAAVKEPGVLVVSNETAGDATVWAAGRGAVERHELAAGESLVVSVDAYVASDIVAFATAAIPCGGGGASEPALAFDGPGWVCTSSAMHKEAHGDNNVLNGMMMPGMPLDMTSVGMDEGKRGNGEERGDGEERSENE